MDVKKECEFGAKCYRKNPKHLEEFSHPVEGNKPKLENKRKRKNDSPKKFCQKQSKLDSFNGFVSVTSHTEKLPPERPKRKRKPVPLAKSVPDSSESDGELCDVTSNSWVFQANSSDVKSETPGNEEQSSQREGRENLPAAEKIKQLFLVEMPEDFYAFYEFCETVNSKNPTKALRELGLKLVGPYDVLNGSLSPGNVSSETALIHWRFFMDPPEFQTVLVAEKGLHFGYWRDEPQAKDTFIASNTVPDCKIKPETPTIFGTVLRYLEKYPRQGTPFEKIKANCLAASLKKYAESKGIDLSSCNDVMTQRKKNVVARTFNDMGIVVPFDKDTQVGYRPLIETNANLKKICQGAIKANTPNSPQMNEIERLLNFANIANDECDFGNGLELGLDLFCMGSQVFDWMVEHLMTTAYTLLKRPEWAEIIKAHLKNRRTGLELSVIKSKTETIQN